MKRNFGKLILAAILLSAFSSCNTMNRGAGQGAVVGAAAGGVLGAIVGNQSGEAGKGTLIGAGLGALTGAVVGDQIDRERNRTYYGRRNGYDSSKVYRGYYNDTRPYDNQWGGRQYWDHKPYQYEPSAYNYRGYYHSRPSLD